MGQPGIVDILTTTEPLEFIVDTAATEVQVIGANWDSRFRNGNNDDLFLMQDNVILESIALRLPYCFTVSTGVPLFEFLFQDQALTTGPIVELGAFTKIPLPDVEIPLSAYIPMIAVDPGTTTGQGFYVGSANINISMIGVPDSLDETVQTVDIMLKVRHTLPMTN